MSVECPFCFVEGAIKNHVCSRCGIAIPHEERIKYRSELSSGEIEGTEEIPENEPQEVEL